MTKSLADLLAMDKLASRHGCALKPQLRQAIEAALRFPARAASPQLTAALDDSELPGNVQRLSEHPANAERKSA